MPTKRHVDRHVGHSQARAERQLLTRSDPEDPAATSNAFVAPDPLVEWLLSDKDRLPAKFKLAI